jgi:hypothetical protein
MAAAQSPTPQPLQYWHVWVDSAGTTHQTRCEFNDFRPLSLGKGVDAIVVDRLHNMPAQVVIAQFPKGSNVADANATSTQKDQTSMYAYARALRPQPAANSSTLVTMRIRRGCVTGF